ncbi:glycosyltransferase [Candidatus Omnitrophota bacterium]
MQIIRFFIRGLIIRFSWLRFLLKRAFCKNDHRRIGFLGDEFFHKDLMPFGGYGMTLRLLTDYMNNKQGLLKGDVFMCENRGFKSLEIKRYHSADLIFRPNDSSAQFFLQSNRIINQRGINVFVGLDHYPIYEYYLKNFPYIPWVIWIKAPTDREVLERIATVPLEAKVAGAKNVEELVRKGEKEGESLRNMLKLSRKFGRKVYFAAESNHLADIARRQFGIDDINPFHWPQPIPLPAIMKPSFSQRPSFFFLGRLDPIKRPWIYFELAKRFKDADFYVGGITHYPHVMDSIIAKYQDLPNLKLMGRIEGEEKIAILDKVWAVVNTSVREGIPVSLLEGFSFGKPAIAALNPDGLTSRFGIYVGEVFGDGNDTESLDRFSEAIEKMINGKFDKERYGSLARQYIADVHSFSRFESSLVRVLKSPSNFEYKVY